MVGLRTDAIFPNTIVLTASTIALRAIASTENHMSRPFKDKELLASNLRAGHLAAVIRRNDHQGGIRPEPRRSMTLRRSGREAVVAPNGESFIKSTPADSKAAPVAADTKHSLTLLLGARPEASAADLPYHRAVMPNWPDRTLNDAAVSSGISSPRGGALGQVSAKSFFSAVPPASLLDTVSRFKHTDVQSEEGIQNLSANSTPASKGKGLVHLSFLADVVPHLQSVALPPAFAADAALTSDAAPRKAASRLLTVMKTVPVLVKRTKAATASERGLGFVTLKAQASEVQGPITTAAPASATSVPVVEITTTGFDTTALATSAPLIAVAPPPEGPPTEESAPQEVSTLGQVLLSIFIISFGIGFIGISIYTGLILMRRLAAGGASSRQRADSVSSLSSHRSSVPSHRALAGRSRYETTSTKPVAKEHRREGKIEYVATVEQKCESYWSGTLFKMCEDGELHDRTTWRERQVWIGQKGVLYYWSKKDNRVSIFFGGTVLKELIVKRLPADKTCYPYCLSIEKPPSGNPEEDPDPTYFAAETQETLLSFLSASSDFAKKRRSS